MFKSTSAKITIGIILITTILLSFVSFFTVYKTRTEFEKVVKQHQLFIRGIEKPINLVPKGAIVQKEFEENLYKTTIFANIISIILAMILGYIIAHQITKPLYTLKNGIKKLREEDFKFEIISDVEGELSEVIDEFNTLIKKLDQSEKLRQNLITDISHDLKTPLTSISLQIEGIKDGMFEPTKERMILIQQQVERLDDLINELRAYTKIKSMTDKLIKTEIGLNQFIKSLVNSFEDKLSKAKIKGVIDIDEEVIINADDKMLEKAISNLIDNTIKYSKANKMIFKYQDGEILIEDDGIGISNEDKKYIFERFYRVDKSRHRSKGGLGLGLAIVKDVIEAHGWVISIDSDENTKGLKYIIKLSQ